MPEPISTWSLADDREGAVVLVHGGAGDVPLERRSIHSAACERAAVAGAKVLDAGGSALDAACAAVRVLEDEPVLNAATGASLNEDGELELDASAMEGTDLRAGAVCNLPPFLAPIAIARAVLDDGEHVLYSGEGARRFAVARGFEEVPKERMITATARARWEATKDSGPSNWAGGTVGAVACDGKGHVAAATSTGGKMGKRRGRVGDSPLLGAGTYADDTSGACSTTGDGEAMIRVCTAKSATDAIRSGVGVEEAARVAIDTLANRVAGFGGLLLVDARGRIAIARNTPMMSFAAAGPRFERPLSG